MPEHHRTGSLLFGLLALVGLFTLAVASGPAVASEPKPNVSVFAAEGRIPSDAAGVQEGIINGTISPAEEVHLDEHLVVVIESPRLAESMANGSGSSTDRFLAELDGPATFRIVQTNPTPQKNRKVTEIGKRNATVYRDRDRTYVLIDLDALDFRYRKANRSAEIFGAERFAVEFGYNLGEVPIGGPYEPSAPVIGLHPYLGQFHTTGYWYEPLPPEWVEIAVEVEIAPEHSLEVRILTGGDRSRTVEVDITDPPGIQSTWVDLRDFEPGTDYVLELVHDGRLIDRFNGTIRTPHANVTNVTVEDAGNQSAVTMTARLSHGGKVQVLNEDCEVLGTEWVEPGEERFVRIELWTRDGQPIEVGNRSDAGLYVRSHRHLGASQTLYHRASSTARIGFDGACAAPEAPATPTVRNPTSTTAGPTAADAATRTRAVTRTGSNGTVSAAGTSPSSVTSPGQPGFSVVTVLLMLVAIALLGRRVGMNR